MSILHDLLDFVFPRECITCGTRLTQDEKVVCVNCLEDIVQSMVRTDDTYIGNNHVEHLIHLMRFSTDARKVIHQAKYRNEPYIASHLGRVAAQLIAPEVWADIDAIVPVPLHWRRRLSRGYNQSQHIAMGISQETGLPIISDAVKRTKHIASMALTQKNRQEREEITRGLYVVTRPEALASKHIMLVDDVFTTGSTMNNCIVPIVATVPDVRISALTLAYASDTIVCSKNPTSPLPTGRF